MNDTKRQDQQLSSLNVVMIFLAIATFFGVCFFTSPPPGKAQDGAIPWAANSVLKAVTDTLAFDFKIPTPQGLAVKGLVAGVAAGLAAIVVAIGLHLARRARDRDFSIPEESEESPPEQSVLKKQIDPLTAAQILLVVFVAWSFLSYYWAPMPSLALGGSLLLLIHLAWMFALRLGLSARACAVTAAGLVAVLAGAALLSVWYRHERNPTMRDGYPIGNPLFFAAGMIPAVMLCFAWIADGVGQCIRGRYRESARLVLSVVALVPICWGLRLADPRGTYLALGVGAVAFVFFSLRGARAKLAVLAVSLVLTVLAYGVWIGPKIAARGETVRTRIYAWDYAYQLVAQRPALGHGQGGYTLLADSLAVQDVADDPRALHARLAHAHSEWLETLVDLGSVGLVTILGCYFLTLLAGVRALRAECDPSRRWLLIGLMSALVAMLFEECLNVALRISPFPTLFYTVVAMIWVLVASDRRPPARSEKSTRLKGRIAFTLAGVCLGLGVIGVSLRDFDAARMLHEYAQSLTKGQFDQAAEQVHQAGQDRLSPSRTLTARSEEAACHVRIAENFLGELLQRVSRLDESSPDFEKQVGEVREAGNRTIAVVEGALNKLNQLTQHATFLYGAHELAGRACNVMVRLALALGDREMLDEFVGRAADAYGDALRRRPFDENLVLKLIEFSPQLQLSRILELMCHPMRYHAVSPRYYQLVIDMAENPKFDDEFQPILAEALAVILAKRSDAEQIGFAPEKLRIAAWVAAADWRVDDARAYAKQALILAEARGDRFPISPAVISRELAHYTFLADADHPEAAIEIARKGKEYLPDSHEARPVRLRLDERQAVYHLAAGNEEAARELILEIDRLRPEALRLELSKLYYSLLEALASLPADGQPEYLQDRLERFLSIAPPLMKADVAQRLGKIDACIDYWKEALSAGVDPRDVFDRLQNALQFQPENEALKSFTKQFRSASGGQE